MAYSYQDFENAAKNAGLLGNFSQYDLDLARRYPEAGLSLLSYKQDYNSAGTAEQRALANAAANRIRSSYGSYTGGDDGLKYYANGGAASGNYSQAKYGSQIDDILGQLGSFGSFSYQNDGAYQKALDAVVNGNGNAYTPPEYDSGRYGGQIDELLRQIGAYGSFEYQNDSFYKKALDDVLNAQPFSWDGVAPEYNNAYAEQQKALLDAILNRPEFSYNREEDPQWSSYKKSYLREGDRATANALAQASAASGGRASSYAVNAASQAGDYYAAQLNDIIPTLYQQAYNRYLQEYQMKLSDLGAVNTQEQLDYNRYLTELGQYNTDRDFAYNAYQGQQNQYLNALNAAMADREQAYNEYLNGYDMLQTYLGNLQGQDNTMYSRYLDSVSRQMAEREYADQRAQQALNALRADREQSYGEYLDSYNMLQNYLGNLQGQDNTMYSRYLDSVAQQMAERESRMQLAQLGASYGDYAGLNALGITPDYNSMYQEALAAAGRLTPVGSGGGGSGSGGSGGGGTAPADGNTIDPTIEAQLKGLYPDGNVTNEAQWNYLLEHYDEKQLNEWGWRFAGGTDGGGAEKSGAGSGESNTDIRNQNGNGWIHVAGMGRMTYEEVRNGVRNGTILARDNADGTVSYIVANYKGS